MTPKGRNRVNGVESSTESYAPKSNTAASVSSRRGDFSPTVRSRQRQNESRTRYLLCTKTFHLCSADCHFEVKILTKEGCTDEMKCTLNKYRVGYMIAYLEWVDLDCFCSYLLPGSASAWADGKLAELAEQVACFLFLDITYNLNCIRRTIESRGREPEREPQQQESGDPADAIKTYLKSGVHKNDPKKIAEMIRRMKADPGRAAKVNVDDGPEEDSAAKSIFEKYGGGGGKTKKKGAWRPASKVQRSAKVFFLGCVTRPLSPEGSHAT